MEKPDQNNDQSNPTGDVRRLSKWFTILLGLIGGGLLTPIVAFTLAFAVLLPAVSGFFGLAGEFDGLWLMGIPVFSLPGGIIGGLVFGSTWKWKYGYPSAWLCASLPAFLFFVTNAWDNEMTKKPRDVFISTAVISGCMALSAAISLMIVGKCFAAFERYFYRNL